MANVQINWTAYATDPGDVDAVEIFRSETLDNESAFQAALDGGTLTSASALQTITDITGTASYTDSTAASGTTYYYCLAAKNAGGYNVGADAPGTTVPAAGQTAGAVARVDV
jgi:hypothetical protein